MQPGKLCIVDETGGYEVKIQTVHEFVRYREYYPTLLDGTPLIAGNSTTRIQLSSSSGSVHL